MCINTCTYEYIYIKGFIFNMNIYISILYTYNNKYKFNNTFKTDNIKFNDN